MSETKDQTIARLEAERDALSARLTEDIKTYDEALTRKTAELAASREVGPCGKHPKMFNKCNHPFGNTCGTECCTICEELSATRASVIEKAIKGYRYMESEYEYKKRLEALTTQIDAAARDERDRRIRLEEATDIRREYNLRIATSFMNWLDNYIIELRAPPAEGGTDCPKCMGSIAYGTTCPACGVYGGEIPAERAGDVERRFSECQSCGCDNEIRSGCHCVCHD